MRVAIDARVKAGHSGGVAQAIASLVKSLGELNDGSETYTIVAGSEAQVDWLKPYLNERHRVVIRPRPAKPAPGIWGRARRQIARSLLSSEIAPPSVWGEVPVSDGFYESLECDVVHFMNQMDFTLCALPTIYNPHDLQHLHYPQFWSPQMIAQRETIYRAGCKFARTVVVGSSWIRDDVITQYQVDPGKVQIIPEYPPALFHKEPSTELLKEALEKYKLALPFMIYPAVTWEHKNHLRLLEAIALLRERQQFKVQLVCTGATYAAWPRIQARIEELQLSSQVKFLGFVSDDELRALYRLAQFLIMPSLFEASSLPVFEAWLEGTPVACANVTALPDQVKDAALLFDPKNTEAIAGAIAQMFMNVELRRELRELGFRRLQDFDPGRTARAYRAVYRQAAGACLLEEDRRLLSWDWMRFPARQMEVA